MAGKGDEKRNHGEDVMKGYNINNLRACKSSKKFELLTHDANL